ncbi:hypothetical protein [Dyadobacter sp. LHD-138]
MESQEKQATYKIIKQ